MQWQYVAMSLTFAGVMLLLSFALAHRQQEADWDCKLEGKDPPPAENVWRLSKTFSHIGIVAAIVALLLMVFNIAFALK